MHSLTPKFLSALRYDGQQLATLRQLGQYHGKQLQYAIQFTHALNYLRQVAIVEATESSSRLAGILLGTPRLKLLVLRNAIPKTRWEQEVVGYRDALALIYQQGAEQSLTGEGMLQLHATLYHYTPQADDNWTPSDTVEPLVNNHPRLPRPNSVSEALNRLTEHYTTAMEQQLADPLLAAPLAVLDFLCIQPFSAGNGRLSRLLTSRLLYQAGYTIGRYISLERIFEAFPEDYKAALEGSSTGWAEGQHDVNPWLNYFWGALLRAHEALDTRVHFVESGRGEKGKRVRQETLNRNTPFSISDIGKACPDVSRDRIRALLRALRAEGLITSKGIGRDMRWEVVSKKPV